ncbi:hypothetical protein NBEOAGPD_5310 [Methylobacterium gregans]|uniref:Uncharacterized protein n=1 Tax=Methylobacterium gregans TaxID=374424 RepID=A0AA37MJ15_9HYPH|nr:hypothetical protein NBEOAGPD_5310 [Methylobacterium gregans]
MDVDRCPEPAHDLSGDRFAVWFGPDEEPAILARCRADAVLHEESAARPPSRIERNHGGRRIVWMHVRGGHLRGRRRLVGLAGVVRPLLVKELGAALGIGDPDDLRDRVGHQPEACLADSQALLGGKALGEVDGNHEQVAGPPIRVGKSGNPAVGPGGRAIRPLVALVERGGSAASHGPLDSIEAWSQILGISHVGDAEGQQLVRPTTENTAQLPVHSKETAIRCDLRQAYCRIGEDGGEPLLALLERALAADALGRFRQHTQHARRTTHLVEHR